MMYLGIALLCLAVVPGSLCNEDIHKYMSPEEVLRVFQTDHDSVPKYEIVKVVFSKRLHKRDLSAGIKMQLTALGENINLWLHPRDSILVGDDTPIYYARYSPYKPGGVEYELRNGKMKFFRRILEDPNRLATLVIGTEYFGGTTIDGFIESNGIAIRSLPPRVAEEYRRRRRSVGDLDNLDLPYHVAFETLKSYGGNYPVLPVNVEALQQRLSQSASGIPDTLYPEILVVVEHSIRRAYGRDIYGLLQYILAFWNGVDLKFRSLVAPRVRLFISYIVIAEDDEATPYITKHRLSDSVFRSRTALYEATKFFYDVSDTFPLNSYDISATLTMKKFAMNRDVLGIAYPGEACSNNHERTWAVALIHDNTAFKGVVVGAHELGHLLGAHHDTGNCVEADGFIMAEHVSYTRNTSDFSPCSLEQFNTHLKESKLDCLFNRPLKHSSISLPKIMPGKMKTLEEQCKALNFGPPCELVFQTVDVCVNFYCRNQYDDCVQTQVAAADGTSCEKGTNKFCLHMKCVSL